MYKKRKHTIRIKVGAFIRGMTEGLLSLRNLKNPWLFIFYTFLIWWLYVFEIYMFYYSISETSSLGFVSGLTVVFLGGVAYAISHGGVGVFPLLVALILALYGVPYDVGFAFGWLIWSTQTAGAIFCGVISFILVKRRVSIKPTVQDLSI